jgi:hypothetical protein
VRRLVLEESIVIGAFVIAPPTVGVVTGLFRQQGYVLGLQVDGALVIRHGVPLISVLHSFRLKPTRRIRPPDRPPIQGDPGRPGVARIECPRISGSVGIVSAPTGPGDDDAFWRRPEQEDQTGPGFGRPASSPEPTPPPYLGPPRTDPPPPDWRPPVVSQPPPPRSLPEQDEAELDEAETSARTVTYGIGMVAGAVLVIVVCLLCARLLF